MNVQQPRKPKWWYRPGAIGLVVVSLVVIVSSVVLIAPRRQVTEFPNGLTLDRMAEVDADLFPQMDGGIQLTQDEIRGRNTWLIWTGGNEDFWNWLAQYGFGTNDLLKVLDSRNRPRRFASMGIINDPDFRMASRPDQFGLWMDERVAPPEPGVDPEVYGRPSGVVGLRLYPNPKFDAGKWDANRFYHDPNYYNDPELERPYMVGMSCGFCHVGPSPAAPPVDPENPQWGNLSSSIGAQYLKTAAVFGNGMSQSSLVFQVLSAMADGTLDTSFLATDNILNPSNMNAIWEVGGRLAAAQAAPPERMGGGNMSIPGQQASMHVPHILKDGADGVGMHGALSRVYVNIGEFHEQWTRNHNILLGGKAQTPFDIDIARDNSIYWQATENRVDNLAKFFIRSAGAMRLADAPGGDFYLAADPATLDQGKQAFANACASCHSSKRPPAGIDGHSPEGKAWFSQAVMQPDFLEGNYLSDDARYPVSEIGTNACRALATNSMRGHVWDNFSSESYKTSPPSGAIQVLNPFDGTTRSFQPQGGGPGYYRTAPLVSMWATAPFFHNNELGIHTHDPSVDGRMVAFNDAIEKLLWPERRLGARSIRRTTQESWLMVPAPYLPDFLQPLADSGFLKIGPVPAGTPVKLLANLDLTLDSRELDRADAAKVARLAGLARKVKNDLIQIQLRKMNPEQSRQVLMGLVPDLLANSKCPDFVEDRGHLYGTDLTDVEKRALIEYLKTM